MKLNIFKNTKIENDILERFRQQSKIAEQFVIDSITESGGSSINITKNETTDIALTSFKSLEGNCYTTYYIDANAIGPEGDFVNMCFEIEVGYGKAHLRSWDKGKREDRRGYY